MESRVKIWIDGGKIFPRIERLIRKAKRSIVIQMFIWKDDAVGRSIAGLLVQAADRGVLVDITKEAVGDTFEAGADFLSTRGGSGETWKRFWSHPRIQIRHEAHGDHTKAFIFDGRILLIGGMNITEEYRHHWHDYFVELRSRRFVEGFLTDQGASSPQGSVRLVMNTEERKAIRGTFIDFLKSARKRILLEQSYFSDPGIIDLLAARSHEGIMVTLIIPRNADLHEHANLQAVERLLASGDRSRIRVFLYPTMLHAKLTLVDRKRVFIGSANMMTSSLDWMGEANILIDRGHRHVLRKLRRAIRADIVRSELLTTIPRMGWIGKIMAWVGL